MSAFTLTPGNLQWLGLSPEATPGTAAAAPTIFVPVDSPKWGAKITALVDQALRGFMGSDYSQAQGSRDDEVSYKTYLYPSILFAHLRAILGGADTVSGTADPYTHKVSLLNTAALPTYTIWVAMGDGKALQVPGNVASDVKLTIKANELPTLDVAWTGLGGTIVTAPANTPSTEAPMPPYTGNITVGGASVGKYTDMTLDLKRNVQPVLTLNGSQNPSSIYGGVLSVTGTLNAVFQGTADSDLTNFLTNGQPALSLSVAPQGDAIHNTIIQCSRIAYDDSSVTGSNNSWMTVSNTFKGLMNQTDATDGKMSNVQVQYKNTASTPL